MSSSLGASQRRRQTCIFQKCNSMVGALVQFNQRRRSTGRYIKEFPRHVPLLNYDQLNSLCKVVVFVFDAEVWKVQVRQSRRADRCEVGQGKDKTESTSIHYSLQGHRPEPMPVLSASDLDDVGVCRRSSCLSLRDQAYTWPKSQRS